MDDAIEVWKVVVDGHSTNAGGRYQLPYRIDQRTYPYGDSKFLFACATEHGARFLMGNYSADTCTVLRCRAKPYEGDIPKVIPTWMNESALTSFWKGQAVTSGGARIVPGWVLCEWIEPLEETA